MMRNLSRAALLAVALLCLPPSASAQSASEARAEIAAIAGRVTVEGEPLPGIRVIAVLSDRLWNARAPLAVATTDAEGRYSLTGLPAGRVSVIPGAPTFVQQGETRMGFPGQTLTLAAGETAENVDLALRRGGVITGRVTDSEGRPVIGETIRLHPVGERRAEYFNPFFLGPFAHQTDDRGIYRIFGLAEGRYRVSVGHAPGEDTAFIGLGRAYYQRTFHPNASDEAQAAIVEVLAGRETTGVDITLGRRGETYSVSGRAVEAESGNPVPNMTLGYGTIMRGDQVGARGYGGRTDARGQFRLDGLAPGRYAIILGPALEEREYYAEPVPFEIRDGDVTGLVVRLRRGATLSGIVTIEGLTNPNVLSRLPQLSLSYNLTAQGSRLQPYYVVVPIGADGSFRLTGLPPGKLTFRLFSGQAEQLGFVIARVERDEVEQRDGIEIERGGHVTGVRVVLRYGTGVVRGQINIIGGALPPNANLYALLHRPGETAPNQVLAGGPVDPRGRFRLEGIPAGAYELRLQFYGPPPPPARRWPQVSQTVHISDGNETVVTLTLDLSAQENPQ